MNPVRNSTLENQLELPIDFIRILKLSSEIGCAFRDDVPTRESSSRCMHYDSWN